MSEQSEKVYVGSGKIIPSKNPQYPDRIRISFSEGDLEKMRSMLNERRFINLNLCQRKEPGKRGETHYMVVDTWKPQHGAESRPLPPSAPENVRVSHDEPMPADKGEPVNDIPF